MYLFFRHASEGNVVSGSIIPGSMESLSSSQSASSGRTITGSDSFRDNNCKPVAPIRRKSSSSRANAVIRPKTPPPPPPTGKLYIFFLRPNFDIIIIGSDTKSSAYRYFTIKRKTKSSYFTGQSNRAHHVIKILFSFFVKQFELYSKFIKKCKNFE